MEPTVLDRLDRLNAEMNALNDALKEMLECDFPVPSGRKHLHRRRMTTTAELMRFSEEAKKLAFYAPY